MVDREEDKVRIRRQLSQEAISLAMENRWDEAAAINRTIIESFPTDVDAYNRLGRALSEMGDLVGAREAYAKAVELAPSNSIARKNLQRLSLLGDAPKVEKSDFHKVAPQLFIGEMGKSGTVSLLNLAPKEVLAKMTAGELVQLRVDGRNLMVETGHGEYLGEVDPRHGLRLAKLIQGGNKYSAALISVVENSVRVMIREVYQDPTLAGRLSFPVKAVDEFRPYVKDSLLRHAAGEEEEVYEGGEFPVEEESEGLPEGFSIVEPTPIPDEIARESEPEE